MPRESAECWTAATSYLAAPPTVRTMERRSIYGWLVVALLWVAVMLDYLDRQAIFSLFPLLRKDLGMSDVALGLIGSVFLWIYGALSPAAGYLGDRFSRRNIIVITLALWSLVTFATGLARTSGELIALRGLMGAAEVCYMPAALVLISDYHPPERRSTAFGLHQTGVYFGAAVSGTFAGHLAEHWGWRQPFHCLGIFGVLYTGLLLALLRSAPKGASDVMRFIPHRFSSGSLLTTFRTVLRTPTLLILYFVVMIVSIYFWALSTWLPLYFYERFSMSLAGAGGVANGYLHATSAIGIILGGPLADSAARKNPRARMMMQFVGLLIPAPFLLVIGESRSLIWAVVALVIFGLGRGLWDCNNMAVICDVASPAVRSTAYGVYNFAGMLGGGIGTLGFGLLVRKAGPGTLFSIACPLALLAASVVWIGMKRFLVNDMLSLQATLQRS
jgi:MFS transporter, Spinster family, sphingosine-1-phosphate transporter